MFTTFSHDPGNNRRSLFLKPETTDSLRRMREVCHIKRSQFEILDVTKVSLPFISIKDEDDIILN
jgi:hypothetical protein